MKEFFVCITRFQVAHRFVIQIEILHEIFGELFFIGIFAALKKMILN